MEIIRSCPKSECDGLLHLWRCTFCKVKVCSRCNTTMKPRKKFNYKNKYGKPLHFIPFNKDEGLRKHYVFKTTLHKGSGYYYDTTLNKDIIDNEKLYKPRKVTSAYMYFCKKFQGDIAVNMKFTK